MICAIDASQMAGGFEPKFGTNALNEVAADMLGRPFAVEDWITRCYLLMGWMVGKTDAEVVASFDKTVARLRSQP